MVLESSTTATKIPKYGRETDSSVIEPNCAGQNYGSKVRAEKAQEKEMSVKNREREESRQVVNFDLF